MSRVGSGGETRGGASPPGAAERIGRLERRLDDAYGTPGKQRRDPLEELVLTILSQNTTDANRDRAWDALRTSFADWNEVRQAPRDLLERTIRVAGLAGQKAAAIQGALVRLAEEVGEPSLDHLGRMDDATALDYLSGFRGVGVKTAACVLCFSLRRPVLPVDTHVRRVSERLGLVPFGASAGRAHQVLNRVVPPDLRFRLHIQLIRHGRATCTARRPACDDCILEEECPRVGLEKEEGA